MDWAGLYLLLDDDVESGVGDQLSCRKQEQGTGSRSPKTGWESSQELSGQHGWEEDLAIMIPSEPPSEPVLARGKRTLFFEDGATWNLIQGVDDHPSRTFCHERTTWDNLDALDDDFSRTTSAYSSSAVSRHLRLDEEEEMQQRISPKRTRRESSMLSWSDGTLHIDFLKCILQIGIQNVRILEDIIERLSHVGVFVHGNYCQSLLNDRQRCEEILNMEYDMAKDVASDLVKSKSRLCKPKLHVYLINPFHFDQARLQEVGVLACIFDAGLKYAKPLDLFVMMNARGHSLACSRKVKSHLQKFTLNSRSSHDAFWKSFGAAKVQK